MLTICKQFTCGCTYERRVTDDGVLEDRTRAATGAATPWRRSVLDTTLLARYGITTRQVVERLRDQHGWMEVATGYDEDHEATRAAGAATAGR